MPVKIIRSISPVVCKDPFCGLKRGMQLFTILGCRIAEISGKFYYFGDSAYDSLDPIKIFHLKTLVLRVYGNTNYSIPLHFYSQLFFYP